MTIAATQANTGETQLEMLTRLNAQDLITAFRLDQVPLVHPLMQGLARIPARRFSRQLQQVDQLIGEQGLAAGGRMILKLFARSAEIMGTTNIPKQGPLIILSNHAGMADVMALWVGLEQRPDLRVIAAERELLRALPNIGRHLLYVNPETGGRTGMLRMAAAHLTQGGALLTFPAGKIEPDPAVYPQATESLQSWSRSMLLLARLVPDAQIMPAAVGGVISASALRNPLLRLFRDQRSRDWAGATLQVLIPSYRDVHTRVAFGAARAAKDLLPMESSAAMRLITTDMAELLTRVGQAANLQGAD